MRGPYGRFTVTGRSAYRGVLPGKTFDAKIDPSIERAIGRRNIRLDELVVPALEPGSYRLPPDWPPRADAPQTEAPKGASLVSEGG